MIRPAFLFLCISPLLPSTSSRWNGRYSYDLIQRCANKTGFPDDFNIALQSRLQKEFGDTIISVSYNASKHCLAKLLANAKEMNSQSWGGSIVSYTVFEGKPKNDVIVTKVLLKNPVIPKLSGAVNFACIMKLRCRRPRRINKGRNKCRGRNTDTTVTCLFSEDHSNVLGNF